MTSSTRQERISHIILLWLGLLLPPLAWSMQMGVMYMLQPWECLHPDRVALSHPISLMAIVIAAAGGLVAWRRWQALREPAPEPVEQLRSRGRFMALLGVSLSALFALVIIALWIPNHLLSPCPL
jgi:hypothetical protein